MRDKPEPRFRTDIVIRIFGIDAGGHPFSQNVQAQNISDHGAGLCGLKKHLNPGDVVGVQLGDKKARCKVTWVVEAGTAQQIEMGVQIVEGQPCPWEKQRAVQRVMDTPPVLRTRPAAKDRRKFPRHRVSFPIEIRDGQSVGSHSQVQTADIGGGGCYIETRIPFPVKRTVNITFWLNSERVHTTAVVRTCDGGVGMGIEFTGLDEATQNQLQRQVETLASALKKARGAS